MVHVLGFSSPQIQEVARKNREGPAESTDVWGCDSGFLDLGFGVLEFRITVLDPAPPNPQLGALVS